MLKQHSYLALVTAYNEATRLCKYDIIISCIFYIDAHDVWDSYKCTCNCNSCVMANQALIQYPFGHYDCDLRNFVDENIEKFDRSLITTQKLLKSVDWDLFYQM